MESYGLKYSDRSVQKVVEKAVEKSGVDPNTTPHTLRHSFATQLILNGVSTLKLQQLLGHASPETTAIYVHLAQSLNSDIKSPLDDLDI